MSSIVNITITCRYYITLIFLAAFVVLLFLGCWQLERAEHKSALLLAHNTLKTHTVDMSAADLTALAALQDGDQVLLEGKFDNTHTFYLDNQIHKRRFGYLVITKFNAQASGLGYFVVRGWVQGSLDRTVLPTLSRHENPMRLTAKMIKNKGRSFKLSSQLASDSWPKVIQDKHPDILQSFDTEPSYGELLWLENSIDDNLEIVMPMVVNVSPQKHQAYALQWFAMATILLLLYLCYATNIVELYKKNNKPVLFERT